MSESFITNCVMCDALIKVRATAKCVTCPECGYHRQMDAAKTNESFKRLMKTVFGEKPEKPENN